MFDLPFRSTLKLLAVLGAAPALAGDTAADAGASMERAAEHTGDAIEQAAEETGDAVEQAADATGDAAAAGGREVAETGNSAGRQIEDAWIDGKLETVYALNRQLDALDIDTDVERGVVTLTGTVANRIEHDLAGELARGVEGVQDVVNELAIAPEATRDEAPGFGQWVADVTTTAVIKSKLLANEHTSGLAIEVDTTADVVTLSGRVESEAARELAAQIAADTDDVERVNNALEVRSM